jgi:hypothetical protein
MSTLATDAATVLPLRDTADDPAYAMADPVDREPTRLTMIERGRWEEPIANRAVRD